MATRAADDFDAIHAALKEKQSVLISAPSAPKFKEGGHELPKITLQLLRQMTLTFDENGKQYRVDGDILREIE